MRCTKVDVVGDEALGNQTCPVLMHKHYQPARRATGERVYFVTREMVQSFKPGTPQGDLVMRSHAAPQLELQVATLPGGRQSMTGVLLLDIDESGQVRDCAVRPVPEPAFPVGMCLHLDLLAQPVQRDRAGQAVGYITSLRVRLTAGTAAAPQPAN